MLDEAVSIADFEPLAREVLDPALFGYLAGGAGDEATLAGNLAAFARFRIRPRVLVDVSATTAATTVLGVPVAMPLLVAPWSFHRLAHDDGEAATARAARRAGTLMCASMMTTTPIEEIAAAGASWLQLYPVRDRGALLELAHLALAAGYRALVLTVDSPRLGRRERDLRSSFRFPERLRMPIVEQLLGVPPGGAAPAQVATLLDPSFGWRDLEELVATAPLPVIVKGILAGEDAELACRHGAAGIIVSNHGGRQLDGVVASLDALPEVVERVAGRVEVLMDGGIRRGTDVVKALALGARAVLVGRPTVFALAAAGEAGVLRVLTLFREETELALALIGCEGPDEVMRAHLLP